MYCKSLSANIHILSYLSIGQVEPRLSKFISYCLGLVQIVHIQLILSKSSLDGPQLAHIVQEQCRLSTISSFCPRVVKMSTFSTCRYCPRVGQIVHVQFILARLSPVCSSSAHIVQVEFRLSTFSTYSYCPVSQQPKQSWLRPDCSGLVYTVQQLRLVRLVRLCPDFQRFRPDYLGFVQIVQVKLRFYTRLARTVRAF